MLKSSVTALSVLWVSLVFAEESRPAGPATNLIEIHSVMVDGRPVSWRPGSELRLSSPLETVAISFGPGANSGSIPIRLHCILEGYETILHPVKIAMNLAIRFYSESGEMIDEKIFNVYGESAGWDGSLKTSPLSHRRETITAPPRASRLMVVISSAGPPDAIGMYAVEGLMVSRASTNGSPQVLLGDPFEGGTESGPEDVDPKNWKRDGLRWTMARSVELGRDPPIRALAIVDDDRIAHAEWHTLLATAPRVAPGDLIVAEWNELFSIGTADNRFVLYPRLPPGNYRFRVLEKTILGASTGVETSLAIRVLPPLWGRSWFWIVAVGSLVVALVAGTRCHAARKMRRQLLRLERQRELEQERLRIARDIHDDLGARVTQISMLSAMAPDRSGFPQNARADFDQISKLSRELVSALYETVWAVNPDNDNLYAVGDYLRQMTSQLCEQAQLRCRLSLMPLPREVQISSQTRHNLSMALKEAVHNIIKHANASEVSVRVTFADMLLTVSIQDDGCGFRVSTLARGNGITNMKTRMESLGGNCVIESQPGSGTCICLRLKIAPLH